MVTSSASSTPVQSMEIFLPSRSRSSTQPVSMLNLQTLSSYFMFVSFPPYGTFTVVTFVIRFFDANRTQNEVLGAYRIESRYRLSTAKSSSAKRMAIRFWTHSGWKRTLVLLSEENKKSEPFSYREKVRIFYFSGSPPVRHSYGLGTAH